MGRSDGSNSPLSSLSSDDFQEESTHDDTNRTEDMESSAMWSDNDSNMPPAKRRRISPDAEDEEIPDEQEIASDISSDTEGSLPVSPSQRNFAADEEQLGKDFLQVCRWDGCDAGDLGNQDLLVEHVHEEHIGNKKSVYKCGWSDCTRKGQAHASAYALRAHMRSHTKEKPFYCALPECDRCFTRSDALAKHMRTVHETEALRPSDHVPVAKRQVIMDRATSPARAPIRLKLNFNKNSPSNHHESPSTPDHDVPWNGEPLSPTSRAALLSPPPDDIHFAPEETEIPPQELFRLLRRQLRWAEEESAGLAAEIETVQQHHREEWLAKELVLENVLEGEFHRASKKGVIGEDGQLDVPETTNIDDVPGIYGLTEDAVQASRLPMSGSTIPWYRQPEFLNEKENRKERALAKANGADEPAHEDEDIEMVAADDGDETEDERT